MRFQYIYIHEVSCKNMDKYCALRERTPFCNFEHNLDIFLFRLIHKSHKLSFNFLQPFIVTKTTPFYVLILPLASISVSSTTSLSLHVFSIPHVNLVDHPSPLTSKSMIFIHFTCLKSIYT